MGKINDALNQIRWATAPGNEEAGAAWWAGKKAGWSGKISKSSLGSTMLGGWSVAKSHKGVMGMGFAAGAAYGILRRDERGPISSSIVMGPLFAGAFLGLTGGGWNNLKAHAGAIGDAMSLPFRAPGEWKGKGGAAFRGKFEQGLAKNPYYKGMSGLVAGDPHLEYAARMSTSPQEYLDRSLSAVKRATVNDQIPDWMRMTAVSAEQATSMAPETLGAMATKETLAGEMSGWSPARLNQRLNADPEFARAFSRRTGFMEKLNPRGIVGVKAAPAKAIDTVANKELISRLGTQGRKDLAAQLTEMTDAYGPGKFTGLRVRGSKDISAIEYHLGAGQRFTVPVTDKSGAFAAGALEENLYVARRQIFLGGLSTPEDLAKAEALLLDEAVAKYVHEFLGKAQSRGTVADLSEYLGRMAHMPGLSRKHGPGSYPSTIGTALLWSRNPARAARTGQPVGLGPMLRGLEQQVSIPQSANIADLFNIATRGDNAVMSVGEFGGMSGKSIVALGQGGRVTAGSEGSAGHGVLIAIDELAALHAGSLRNPLDKSLKFLRDNSKGYWMEGGDPYRWRPFQTSKLKSVAKGKGTTGIAMHYSSVMESEVSYISEQFFRGLNSGRDASVQAIGRARKFMRDMGVASSEMGAYRKALLKLAEMDEGMFLSAMPSDVSMSSLQHKVIYNVLPGTLNEAKPGDVLFSATQGKGGMSTKGLVTLGLDEAGLPITHNLSEFGEGKVILRSKSAVPGVPGAMAIAYDEQIAGRNVKVGSDIIKGFNRSITQKEAELILNFINKMRDTPGLKKAVYGNMSYVPALLGAEKNTVQAFTLGKTFTKFQSDIDVMGGTLNSVWLNRMNKAKQAEVLKKLAGVGVTQSANGLVLQVGASATKNRKTIGAAAEAMKGIYHGMVTSPGEYFDKDAIPFNLSKSTVTGKAITKDEAVAYAFSKGGIVAEGVAWDAYSLSNPSRAPISAQLLAGVRNAGMPNVEAELLARRAMPGTAEATIDYAVTLNEYARGGAKYSRNVSTIPLTQTGIGILETNELRRSAILKETFLIDLNTARGKLSEAQVKGAFSGRTNVLVPGIDVDLWGAEYRTTSGQLVNQEKFLGPLHNAMAKFREAAATGDAGMLEEVNTNLNKYIAASHAAMQRIGLGTSGTSYDGMGGFGRRAIYKDYTQRFGATKGLTSSQTKYIVGLNPEDYKRLTGSYGKKMSPWQVSASGKRFLQLGKSFREPLTFPHPAIFVSDPSLPEGAIGTSAQLRFIKAMDFDGDTLYAIHIKDSAARSDLMKSMFNKKSVQYKTLNQQLKTARALGGVYDDMELMRIINSNIDLSEMLMKGGLTPELFKAAQEATDPIAGITKRLGRFRVFDENAIPAGEFMAKYATRHIGQYSNLSRRLAFASLAMTDTTTEAVARSIILERIQQVSIDFARKQQGIVDPGDIGKGFATAFTHLETNVDEANKIFATQMRKLGLLSDTSEITLSMKLLEELAIKQGKSTKELGQVRDDANKIMSSFFSNMDDPSEFRGLYAASELIYRKQLGNEVSDEFGVTLSKLSNFLEARETAAGRGMPFAGGTAAGESAERLRAWNRAVAGARGTRHVAKKAWNYFKGSRAFKPLAAGAIATGGLMAAFGFMSSPAELDVGDYKGRGRALMRSPDGGLVGAAGTLLPGAGGGTAARTGEMSSPRRVQPPPQGGAGPVDRRMYVQQTNRVPRVRMGASGDPYDVNAYAEEASGHLQRMAGGRAYVNVVHDGTSRRMSEIEIADRMRNEMAGGR